MATDEEKEIKLIRKELRLQQKKNKKILMIVDTDKRNVDWIKKKKK